MVSKTLFRAHSQERDSGETAVDVEAARLVAQKLGENGIGGYMLFWDVGVGVVNLQVVNMF